MQDESTRNTIIFIVCALILLMVYQQFVTGPQQKKQAELAKQHAVAAAQAPKITAPVVVSRDQALAASQYLSVMPAQAPEDVKGWLWFPSLARSL